VSLQRIVATVPYRLVRVLSEMAWLQQSFRREWHCGIALAV
jgi:hypothetical protein